MHQTDGAVLYCFPADGGYLLWALQRARQLVHMEGSPAVVERPRLRRRRGGRRDVRRSQHGHARRQGTDPSRTCRPCKRPTGRSCRRSTRRRRRKTPTSPSPPTENDLLKPAPKPVWTQGQKRWHVDAPLLVAGDKVLVASAFLDKEKEGERALFCLNAADGKELWKAPLTYNPWGGPTLAGDTVIVTTSTHLLRSEGTSTGPRARSSPSTWRPARRSGRSPCPAACSAVRRRRRTRPSSPAPTASCERST